MDRIWLSFNYVLASRAELMPNEPILLKQFGSTFFTRLEIKKLQENKTHNRDRYEPTFIIIIIISTYNS